MPGLVGFITQDETEHSHAHLLETMIESICHFNFHKKLPPFADKNVYSGQSQLDIISERSQPCQFQNIYAWLDGEFYNKNQLCNQYNISYENDTQLLLKLYCQSDSFSFLRDIDGHYNAVIYDASKQILHLITDRYGLKFLYWSFDPKHFSWSSELKAFATLPWFSTNISRDTVHNFLQQKYFVEDTCWFNSATLLAAGTVLTYHIQDHSTRQKKYWDWDEIKPLTGKLDETAIAHEMGRLFKKAVRKQTPETENLGVTLSGGLDSRAIFAALPEIEQKVYALTFGKEHCDDIRIAKIVASQRNAQHDIIYLNADNWLTNRIRDIWLADGQFNLIHMHSSNLTGPLREHCNINLDGFLGDAIPGGSYSDNPNISAREMIINRGRRFINEGGRILSSHIINRHPFFDNDLMEFTLSIPEYMREKSKIYNLMLLHTFSRYYQDIPWRTTGMPIGISTLNKAAFRAARKIKNIILKASRQSALLPINTYYSHNMEQWIRQEPAKSLFTEILTAPTALFPEYTAKQPVIEKWHKHLSGENHFEDIGCIITTEVWLRQLFKEKVQGINLPRSKI